MTRNTNAPAASEKRWAVIAPDGRHVWLGRASDPSKDEILRAEAGLRAQGRDGLLVVVAGDYWRAGIPLEVRRLAEPSTSFAEAVTAFQAARKRRLRELQA